MGQTEFMDRLFDIVNESDSLPVQDIVTDAAENIIKVYLADVSIFQIQCAASGYWWILVQYEK